ncbi:MAG: carboxypeptidase-like regulatory domain-containing protein [Acidobacteriota bacterium]
MRRLFGLVTLTLALSLPLAGQSGAGQAPGQPVPGMPGTGQRTPPRGAQPPRSPDEALKGTAVLRGLVVAADSGAPIRRARVAARAAEGSASGSALTNDEGRFEIKELPAGRFAISASKSGYVTLSYGQRRPNQPGTPVELADGQVIERLQLALPRGGVITGRVFDDVGDPMAGVDVAALQYRFAAGGRMLARAGDGGADRTDDQGSFRLYGLPPGEYIVSGASRQGTVILSNVASNEADGYPTTYYPGTPNAAEAARVTVRTGQETGGVNFALALTRMARVAGRAVNAQGQPLARGMLMLLPADQLFMSVANVGNSMLRPDGTFQFNSVAPGRYELSIRPMGPSTPDSEFASIPVTVGTDDIDNLLVVTAVGARATGTIVTDEGTLPPFRSALVQIFATPTTFDRRFAGGGPAAIRDDFTFELSGLSGRSLVRAGVEGSGWYLKAILHDGQDVTDTGLDFTPGATVDGLQVVLTQKVTELSGAVLDDRGRAVLDADVVVFAANPDRWTFQSRHVRTARPDQQGRYSIKNLPPGDDYLVVAVRDLEAGEFADPGFLQSVRDLGVRVTLGEGEMKVQDVRVVPRP